MQADPVSSLLLQKTRNFANSQNISKRLEAIENSDNPNWLENLKKMVGGRFIADFATTSPKIKEAIKKN